MVNQQRLNPKPYSEIPVVALTKPNQRSNSQKGKPKSSSIAIANRKNLSIDTEEINRESEMRGEYLGEKALMNL